jgi:soluble lytic murein transglycosylase-like protein
VSRITLRALGVCPKGKRVTGRGYEQRAMHCGIRQLGAALGLTFLACATPGLAIERTASVQGTYASVMRTINPKLPEYKSLAYASALLTDARRLHVDPTLMMAVVAVESHWNSAAISPHGAEGLGQLKPGTARDLGVNPLSATGNLRGLALYLHRLIALFSAAREPMREAIAGYNAGPYAVQSYGGVPNGEARRYVGKVMSAWHAVRTKLGDAANPAAQPTERDLARAVDAMQAAYWGAP